MNMIEFMNKYESQSTASAGDLIKIWEVEIQTDSVLNTVLSNGETVLQILLHPEARHDGLSNDLLRACSRLMGTKADTAEEVRRLLVKQAHNGPRALQGILSKIQGQIGEDHFRAFLGSSARAAKSGSQEGWDIANHAKNGTEHYQVKIYKEPSQVYAEIKKVKMKLAAAKILDGKKVVRKIPFAVNDDILAKVKRGVKLRGLNVKVVAAHTTRAHARSGFEAVSKRMSRNTAVNASLDIAKGIALSAALVGTVNAYQVYKGQKNTRAGLEDTAYQSISQGGATASMVALKIFASAVGMTPHLLVSTAAVYTSRAVLERFLDRRFVVPRMESENEALRILIKSFAQSA